MIRCLLDTGLRADELRPKAHDHDAFERHCRTVVDEFAGMKLRLDLELPMVTELPRPLLELILIASFLSSDEHARMMTRRSTQSCQAAPLNYALCW